MPALELLADASSTASVSLGQTYGGLQLVGAASSAAAVHTPGVGRQIRVVVVHVDGTIIGDIANAVVSPISYALNDAESWTVTLPQNDPATPDLMIPFTELQIWRGDQLLAWGPITRWAHDRDTLAVQCRGALWHLTRRYIGQANRHNWVSNGSFEDGLNGWNFVTNAFNIAAGVPHAQPDPPTAASITFPKVEGRRAMSLENSVPGADAWADQGFTFTVDAGQSPEGDVFTLKGYVYVSEQIPAGQGAFENRGLYLERFSSTQLDPRPEVQAVSPGAPLTLEHVFVPLDEETPVGVWSRFEIELTTPPKGGESEIINVRLYAPAGVAVYWDAVSLTLIEKLAFYGVDQAQIVQGIVQHLQDSNYDKSDVNISTSCPPTGILRTRIYIHSEHPPGWAALQEFNGLDDGLDYRVVYTPTDRIFTTYYPNLGVPKPGYPVRLPQWPPGQAGNITDWSVAFDGEQASSSVIVLGSGNGSDREEGGAVDVSSWADGVTMEEVFTAPDGTSIDSLGSLANERLRIGRNPTTIQVTLAPAAQTGMADLVGNVWPGDEIPVTIIRRGLNIDAATYRVVASTIDLQAGTMQLTLNPPIVR